MPCEVTYTNDKYGVAWKNEAMHELRRHECLCLRCGNIDECTWAVSLLATCQATGLSMMITRCPKWKEMK